MSDPIVVKQECLPFTVMDEPIVFPDDVVFYSTNGTHWHAREADGGVGVYHVVVVGEREVFYRNATLVPPLNKVPS